MVLYAATSAPDTDFTAKLVDVFPERRSAQPHRRHPAHPLSRWTGESGDGAAGRSLPRSTIDAGVTSNVFLAGHSIRLEISSSNFPRFDRNPNTGGRVRRRDRAEESVPDRVSRRACIHRTCCCRWCPSVTPRCTPACGMHRALTVAIDFAERLAVWCEKKPVESGQGPHSFRRGSQVVRQRSAKPLFVSSILTRASNNFSNVTAHALARNVVSA